MYFDSDLDPSANARMVDEQEVTAVESLVPCSLSENTMRAYRNAARYWAAWYRLVYGRPISLPLPPAVLIRFILDHAELQTDAGLKTKMSDAVDQALVDIGYKKELGARSISMLSLQISAVSTMHRQYEDFNPTQNVQVKKLLSRVKKEYFDRGIRPRSTPPAVAAVVEALISTCDDSLKGIRDRAMILFAWSSGGRRRSEVAAATYENLTKIAERAYVYRLTPPADSISCSDVTIQKPVIGPAADALTCWLDASGIRAGFLFRKVHGPTIGDPLGGGSINSIVKRRCNLAGIDERLTAQSLRSGFVAEAVRQDIPIAETMTLSGLSSLKSMARCYKMTAAISGRAAYLYPDNE